MNKKEKTVIHIIHSDHTASGKYRSGLMFTGFVLGVLFGGIFGIMLGAAFF